DLLPLGRVGSAFLPLGDVSLHRQPCRTLSRARHASPDHPSTLKTIPPYATATLAGCSERPVTHVLTAVALLLREWGWSFCGAASCRSRSVKSSTISPVPIRMTATKCSPASLTRTRNATPVIVAAAIEPM